MSHLNTLDFRNPTFDTVFIAFLPVLAIFSAYVVVFSPRYFDLVLFLDLSLLGYHHVISTYTRLSKASLTPKEFRFLVFILPVLMIVLVTMCALSEVRWLIPTIYLYWQWWHYTRQSEGIAKAVRFKTNSLEAGNGKFNQFIFYLVPVAGLLFASAKQPATFLFMPVFTVPVPIMFANYFLVLTLLLWSAWFVMQINALKNGKIAVWYFVYLVSHHIIYAVSYIFIDNLTFGWLAINIWHNAQYILFVWHFNTNKFKRGFDKQQPILSWISQTAPQRVFIYFSFCFILTLIFYGTVNQGISLINHLTLLPVMTIAYQTINFHHYVVDAMIWKIRKPEIRSSLGIKA